jgi:ABC-type multidrug transport system ATPase subunit
VFDDRNGMPDPDHGFETTEGTLVRSRAVSRSRPHVRQVLRVFMTDLAAKWDIGFASEDMRLYENATFEWHMRFVRSIYPSWDQAYAQLFARHEVLRELTEVMGDDHRSILFSSHNTQDVEQISDQITFIDRGRIIDSRD